MVVMRKGDTRRIACSRRKREHGLFGKGKSVFKGVETVGNTGINNLRNETSSFRTRRQPETRLYALFLCVMTRRREISSMTFSFLEMRPILSTENF